MMEHCAGRGAGSCTRRQFDWAFAVWALAGEREGQHPGAGPVLVDADTGANLKSRRHPPRDVSEPTGDPCGPSQADFAEGEEQPVRTWDGAKCFKEGTMGTWLHEAVCHHVVCRCLPTMATKRVAKLGLMGALSMFALANV